MPKGKGKRSHQPATRRKGPRVMQLTDENLSGDDENAETQSVASQGSTTGTPSGEDGAEVSDDIEDVEDDFEQVLADHIDGTTQKSSKGRQSALSAVAKALRSRILGEFVSERKMTILDGVERCLKRGQPKDRVLAASIGALVCIQLGSTVDGEEVFRILKSHLMTVIQDPTVDPAARTSCATCLGLCCFIASEDPEELQEITNLYEKIFDTNKTVQAAYVPLHNSALLAWALILSIMPQRQAYSLINRHLTRMTYLIESSGDVNLKVTAGEVLALMYEIGRDIDEDFAGEDDGLCDLLKELATDGNKHKAKKDRRVQRASFRDILRAVEDGSVPEEVVKFGSECIELDMWSRRRQYMAFKDALGTGVTVHLQENELLRDIFDLGAPVKPAEVHKASRFERQMYNNAASKARTLSRNKHRDKRTASIY